LWGAPQDTPARKVLVRRDIMTLAPDGPEIAAFRKAVQVMKSRDKADPTSWEFQARIHTKACQHGNYYFLPWHRMYGYWFERVIREASGDPNFTVPYWNYINPTARALPEAMRVPAGAANSLYVAKRNQDAGGINNGARLPPSATAVIWNPMRVTNFATSLPTGAAFGGLAYDKPQNHPHSTMGSFESYHNVMHILLGGEGGLMSDLGESSLDPLFLLHHNNVDRLWKRWLDQGGGRANPLDDKTWMDAEFTFWNEKGKEVKMKVRDCLDTDDQLNYRYDDDPPPHEQQRPVPVAAAKAWKQLAASKGQPVDLGTDPVRITIGLPDAAGAAARRKDGALAILVEGIHFEKEPMIYYEVYLNLPPEEEPDFQSVYYAGNLVFAGIAPSGAKGHKKMVMDGHKKEDDKYLGSVRPFDVTSVVRELRARKLWNDKVLTVTFVLRGLVPVNNADVTRPGLKACFEKVKFAGDG
jgi:hypothetical protein